MGKILQHQLTRMDLKYEFYETRNASSKGIFCRQGPAVRRVACVVRSQRKEAERGVQRETPGSHQSSEAKLERRADSGFHVRS